MFEIVLIGAVLALIHWQFASAGRDAWPLLAIDTALVCFATATTESYWQVFPRGTGHWTANRLSAGAFLLACIWLPTIARQIIRR